MIVATVVGVLSGCGAMGRDQWVYAKPGVTEAQQRQDEQACREQAVGSLEIKTASYGGDPEPRGLQRVHAQPRLRRLDGLDVPALTVPRAA